MTREYVELAIKEGLPFEINMADGKSYRVEDEFSIALIGKTAVIVVEKTLPRILPLLTVTGISSEGATFWGRVIRGEKRRLRKDSRAGKSACRYNYN